MSLFGWVLIAFELLCYSFANVFNTVFILWMVLNGNAIVRNRHTFAVRCVFLHSKMFLKSSLNREENRQRIYSSRLCSYGATRDNCNKTINSRRRKRMDRAEKTIFILPESISCWPFVVGVCTRANISFTGTLISCNVNNDRKNNGRLCYTQMTGHRGARGTSSLASLLQESGKNVQKEDERTKKLEIDTKC